MSDCGAHGVVAVLRPLRGEAVGGQHGVHLLHVLALAVQEDQVAEQEDLLLGDPGPPRRLMSFSRWVTVAWWCMSMYLSRAPSFSSAHSAYFGISARVGGASPWARAELLFCGRERGRGGRAAGTVPARAARATRLLLRSIATCLFFSQAQVAMSPPPSCASPAAPGP